MMQQREQYYPYMTVPNPYVPTGIDQQMANQIVNTMYANQGLLEPYQIPVIKKYNVSLGGISGDHTRIAEIYEDILPSGVNLSLHSFSTLKERFNISDFVRSVFVKMGDGEEVILNGGITKPGINKGTTSLTNLLSRVKFLEINPYHFSRLTNNPYKTIPKNFVMYRSCYPIKMDKEKKEIRCSKTNVGMHIRIYGLTNHDIISLTKTDNDKFKSDLYREIEYYKLINNKILRKYQTPNFVQMYTYYRAKNMNINFKQFELLRDNIAIDNIEVNKENNIIKKNDYENRLKEILENNNPTVLKNLLYKYKLLSNTDINDPKKVEEFKNNKLKLILDKIQQEDDNIVILTESPTQNILNWATKTYEIDPVGSINKMIQTGFYSDEVWESIIFQLYISLLIMYKECIIFNNFSLENNVFIKHLQNDTTNIGYWKYTIDDIVYNVRNYSYLLIIDSSYIDLDNKPDYYKSKDNITHKIISKDFSDDEEKIKNRILEIMLKVFNRDNFGTEFKKFDGNQPSDEILKLLDIINKEIEEIQKIDVNDREKELSILILKVLTKTNKLNYISNRIGTLLTKDEISTLIKSQETSNILGQNKYNRGDIVARQLPDNLFNYCMILDKDVNDMIEILTTEKIIYSLEDKPQYKIIKVRKEELLYQSQMIEEKYITGFNYSRLESYKIN